MHAAMLLGRDAVWPPFRAERGSISLAFFEQSIGAISRDSCAAKSDLRSSRTVVSESSVIEPDSAAE